MHIFSVKDAYDFEKFPKVSKRKRQFKEREGGQGEVCELVENYATWRAKEEIKGNARRFFENGANYEMVRASITILSDEELQSIYAQVQG